MGLILKFVSVSLDFSLSFHHGEGDEGDEGHEGREREREGDEGDEGHEGRERDREGDEGDEGHEVSSRGVIGAWAWLRRVVVSTSLLSVGQKMQLKLLSLRTDSCMLNQQCMPIRSAAI